MVCKKLVLLHKVLLGLLVNLTAYVGFSLAFVSRFVRLVLSVRLFYGFLRTEIIRLHMPLVRLLQGRAFSGFCQLAGRLSKLKVLAWAVEFVWHLSTKLQRRGSPRCTLLLVRVGHGIASFRFLKVIIEKKKGNLLCGRCSE
mgnify:CR=1 FL=1